MQKILRTHPTFNYTQDIKDICLPLERLDIQYFSHVHIDKKGKFSGISNGPDFADHYIKHKYYNADIHMASNNTFGSYVIWDAVERYGQSAKMHAEAAQFGIQHTFTIIERTQNNGSHFFHFANNSSSQTINQIYLTNLDLLNMFTHYFREKVNASPLLKSAYDLKFELDKRAKGYTVKEDHALTLSEKNRKHVAKLLSNCMPTHSTDPVLLQISKKCLSLEFLTKRENECLYHLLHGKTVKEIGNILAISPRTVDTYIVNSKMKMQVQTRSQLIEKIITLTEK